MGILPYAPSLTGVSRGVATAKTVFAFSMAGLAKTIMQGTEAPSRLKERERILTEPKPFAVPKFWQPTLAFQREKFRHLSLEVPIEKERKKLVPISIFKLAKIEMLKHKPLPFEVPISGERAVPIAIPIFKQVMEQIQKLKHEPIFLPPRPTPTPIPIPPPFRAFRSPEAMFKRRKGGLFGAWYLKKHPLPTGTELSRRLLGQKKRKKKGKRKRKR